MDPDASRSFPGPGGCPKGLHPLCLSVPGLAKVSAADGRGVIFMRWKLGLMVLLTLWLAPVMGAIGSADRVGREPCDALTNATIVVIRHAEKPLWGADLAPAGSRRAQAYADYFQQLPLDGQRFTPDHLFCTADSKGSHRTRLTLEPLSRALKLTIDHRFADKNAADLGRELRSQTHGRNLLICWHHGKIPVLLRALGADPESVLPKGQWPDEVFDWIIELHYDAVGRLQTARCRPEKLMLEPTVSLPK